ncbi:MAG: hypothetical protein JNJ57_16310 [Saprospiraceae bacterium]|nr:hypothetical protein [Saprospiraceae bacterium]
MDALEKRIQDLQQALENVEIPDEQAIWSGIKTLPETKRPWWHKPGWWVAFALVLLGTGAGLGYWWNESTHQQREPVLMAELPEPWQQKAADYQKLVSEHELEMRALLTNNSDLPSETAELELLEQMHRDFMSDFQTLPKDEKTASRYLHYYEQKIRILKLIIKEIQLRKNETEKQRTYDI